MWIRPLIRYSVYGGLFCTLCFGPPQASNVSGMSGAKDVGASEADASSRESEMSAVQDRFQGKVVCSLKRTVVIPFKGTIQRVLVRGGQPVRQGDVLATYRIAGEMVPVLKRRIAAVHVKDLELALSEVQKNLTLLGGKRRELAELVTRDLGPAQALKQLEAEIQAAEKQKAAIVEKLAIEKELVRDDLEVLRDQLGGTIKAVNTDEPVKVVAPISGHVVWVNPELRENAEILPGAGLFVVGVMDPMLMRAQVHEMEAVSLSVGDAAQVTFESLPGQVFEGTVSRMAWSPLTPALEQPTYYEMELALPNPKLVLREGMKGEASLRKPAQR